MNDIVKEREKEAFHLLIHFPSSHNNWGWARPKPEVQNRVQVSHMSIRGLHTWAIHCFSRSINRELEQKPSKQE